VCEVKIKTMKKLKAELLANPAVRQAYDAQAPEFELARKLTASRTEPLTAAYAEQHIMEITSIRTEKDYRAALRVVSTLVDQDPSPDTPEGERLDVLSTLIEAYERKHHPIDLPYPHRH
jgi:hypothetical protein